MAFTKLQTKLNKALTTNADGDYALRTMIEGTQDMGGGYILNDQTTTNMMSKGTVYKFDGVDDFIAVDALAVHLNNTSNTVGAVNWVGSIGDLVSGSDNIWTFGDTSANEYLFLTTGQVDGTLRGKCRLAGTDQWAFDTDGTFLEDTDMDIRMVHDGTAPVLYVNGILQAITFEVDTDKTIWFADLTGIDNCRLGCGNWATQGNVNFAKMTANQFGYDNFAPTASEVKDLISGNLDAKWQYGSQVALVTGWTNASSTLAYETLTASGAAISSAINTTLWGEAYSTAFAVEAGQSYKITFSETLNSGTAPQMKLTTAPTGGDILYATQETVNGSNSFEFMAVADSANAYLRFVVGSGVATDFAISALSVTAQGAVALYDNTSISATTWYDKANGNDGDVTGAEVLNAPSVTPLSMLRAIRLKVEPGATAGTNLNCTVTDVFNPSAITDATNLANDSTVNSFTLNDGSTALSIVIPESLVEVIGAWTLIHDVNNSSTTEMYFPRGFNSGGLIQIAIAKRGSAISSDLRTVLSTAGDRLDITILYVTST